MPQVSRFYCNPPKSTIKQPVVEEEFDWNKVYAVLGRYMIFCRHPVKRLSHKIVYRFFSQLLNKRYKDIVAQELFIRTVYTMIERNQHKPYDVKADKKEIISIADRLVSASRKEHE